LLASTGFISAARQYHPCPFEKAVLPVLGGEVAVAT